MTFPTPQRTKTPLPLAVIILSMTTFAVVAVMLGMIAFDLPLFFFVVTAIGLIAVKPAHWAALFIPFIVYIIAKIGGSLFGLASLSFDSFKYAPLPTLQLTIVGFIVTFGLLGAVYIMSAKKNMNRGAR